MDDSQMMGVSPGENMVARMTGISPGENMVVDGIRVFSRARLMI